MRLVFESTWVHLSIGRHVYAEDADADDGCFTSTAGAGSFDLVDGVELAERLDTQYDFGFAGGVKL